MVVATEGRQDLPRRVLFAARASIRRPRALEGLDQSFGLLEEELVNGGEIGSDLASAFKVPPQLNQLPLKRAGEVQWIWAPARAGCIKVYRPHA
jgi:hypothetical protein